MSFFSIVIPAYNVQDYIDKCLNSIIDQSFSDYEVIVVDDESTDNTYEIASKYASSHDNIHVKRVQHVAVGEVRNYAIQSSSGDYIVFIDADDYIEKDFLLRISECLSKYPSDICFLPNHFVDNDSGKITHDLIPQFGEVDATFDKREDFLDYITMKHGVIPASMWTGVCSSLVIDKYDIKMNRNYIWSQDTDFMYQVLAKASRVSICGYRGYVWNRKNIDSATRNVSANKVISRLSVYKKWYMEISKDCFGNISSETKSYLMGRLLKNYIDVLGYYAFMKNKKERYQVEKVLLNDNLIHENPALLPTEFRLFGLRIGRTVFILRSYMNSAKRLVRRVFA